MKRSVIKKFILFLIAVKSFSCSPEISVLVKNAIDSYNEGKYLTTLFFSEQALLENPEDKDALLIAAKAHLKLEEYENADNYLDRLSLLSDNPEIFFIKSQIKIGLEDYETALIYLIKYFEKDSKRKNELAYFNIAYCYYQLGNYEKALENYLMYSKLNPKDSETLLNIAYLYGYMGSSDSSIAYYNKVLSIDSTNFNALYNRSVEYQNKKNYKLAIADLELLSQFYPENTDVLMDLAKLKIIEKKYFGAINDLTKVIKLDSLNAEAYFLRGKILLDLHRNFSACNDFLKAGELGYFEAYEMIRIYCLKKYKN